MATCRRSAAEDAKSKAGAPLNTVTDPRGLVTTMHYTAEYGDILPYSDAHVSDVYCYRVDQPNGIQTWFGCPDTADTSSLGGPAVSDVDTDYPYWIECYPDGQQWECDVMIEPTPTTTEIEIMQFEPAGGGAGSFILSEKTYLNATQDLLTDSEYDYANAPGTGTFQQDRGLFNSSYQWGWVTTNTTYNFMENPMTQMVTEQTDVTPQVQTSTVQYAYWDQTKYFQQKAVLVCPHSGRQINLRPQSSFMRCRRVSGAVS